MEYRTIRLIESATRGGLRFTIPVGSAVRLRQWTDASTGLTGHAYEVEPSALPLESIERHDATYYGVSVRFEDIEAV